MNFELSACGVGDSTGRRDEAAVLLCLSHLRWNFVYQRPQHLLSRAANSYNVIFFEEPVFEPSRTEATLDLALKPNGITVAVPLLPEGLAPLETARLQQRLLDELLAGLGPRKLTTWYYTPYALTFTRHLDPSVCVYDNMDELSAFRGASPELVALEKELFERADIVFTGGRSLYEAKRDRHDNIHCFPSSIDFSHFAKARQPLSEAPAQTGLSHPRVGFFGVIDERMNVELVSELAALRPDWQMVMIGPVVKIDPQSLPQRANLHWVGSKQYTELPAYLAGWDIGFMPFAINEATRFISPTKTPEFLAAGLPVVSTPITDVVNPYGDLGLVEIAADAASFEKKISALLARPKGAWTKAVDGFLANTSWDETWRQMERVIEDSARVVSRRPNKQSSEMVEAQSV
jgi:glycosyltransferase involved in cell wall biosynthesis